MYCVTVLPNDEPAVNMILLLPSQEADAFYPHVEFEKTENNGVYQKK